MTEAAKHKKKLDYNEAWVYMNLLQRAMHKPEHYIGYNLNEASMAWLLRLRDAANQLMAQIQQKFTEEDRNCADRNRAISRRGIPPDNLRRAEIDANWELIHELEKVERGELHGLR